MQVQRAGNHGTAREKGFDVSGLLRPRARSGKGLKAECCYGGYDVACQCLNDGFGAT